MGKCWNCKKEITLKEDEVRCDSCGEIVKYSCWYCTKFFYVLQDDDTKVKECDVCGYFICPDCGRCNQECPNFDWRKQQQQLIDCCPNNCRYNDARTKKEKKLIDDIIKSKIGKKRTVCPKRGVYRSYKERIKKYYELAKGINTKNKHDRKKYVERFKRIKNMVAGESVTVNQTKDDGTYGQEDRDALNATVCFGWMEKEWIEKDDGTKYERFTRIKWKKCEFFDVSKLQVKYCTNKKCPDGNNKKSLPMNTIQCCLYKKDTKYHKKGEPYLLKIKKQTNVDICQLNDDNFIGEIKWKTAHLL